MTPLSGVPFRRLCVEQTSSWLVLAANVEQTSSKLRANIELAQAGLLEPRPLAQM